MMDNLATVETTEGRKRSVSYYRGTRPVAARWKIRSSQRTLRVNVA